MVAIRDWRYSGWSGESKPDTAIMHLVQEDDYNCLKPHHPDCSGCKKNDEIDRDRIRIVPATMPKA